MKTAQPPADPQQITWDAEQAIDFTRRLAKLRVAIVDARRAQKEARETYRSRRKAREDSLSELLACGFDRLTAEDLGRVLDLRRVLAERDDAATEARQQCQLARVRREKAIAEMLAMIDAWKRPLPLFDGNRQAPTPEPDPTPAYEPEDDSDGPLIGEPIELLGVSPESLRAAYIGGITGAGAWGKVPLVKPVQVNGKLYIVQSIASSDQGLAWNLLPLHEPTGQVRFEPGRHDDFQGYYHGCEVRIGRKKDDMRIIGHQGEARRLIQRAAAAAGKESNQ